LNRASSISEDVHPAGQASSPALAPTDEGGSPRLSERTCPSVASLETNCPWTTRLLKRLGRFECNVDQFCRGQNVSPCAEKAGEQFLFAMSASRESLVFAMARFELALMRVRQGSADEYLVIWDRNPEVVFQSLRSGSDLPPVEANLLYRTCVSRDIPGLVSCEPVRL
jgi:hypothetical protein